MPRPKMTDEQYLERFGFTREEGEERKKQKRMEYNRRYQANLRKKKGKKKRMKKGTAVTKRTKTIPATVHLHSGATLPIIFTTKDLLKLKQIEFEINELHAGAINNYILSRINERNERRNSHD